MTNKLKSLLKTTAAIATLFAGSQTWGSGINVASINTDGTLAGSKAYHGTVAAGSGSALVAPDKSAVVLNSTASTMISGGVVALGGNLTIDVGVDAWTLLDLVATKNLNLFIRSATKGAAIPTFIITNLVLADKAELVKVWISDITDLTLSGVSTESKPGRLYDDLVETDVPSPAPTMVVGGRSYTLDAIVSIK